MTFERSWVLFLTFLPLAWAAWEWTRWPRKLGLILKALAFVAVIVALAEPSMTLEETRLAVAVLVDTSSSASSDNLAQANSIAAKLDSAHGRHWMRLIPFARGTRAVEKSEQGKLVATAGDAGRATNLESSVREAIAALPAGMIPRVTLISDGKENQGSIARAAWQARELGIPIDTFALPGRPKPALRLESVSTPPVAFTGEQFPIDLLVSAPSPTAASIELAAEGRPIGTNQISLNAGENRVRLHTSLNTPGALGFSISIRPQGSTEIRADLTVTLRKPKVLYYTGDLEADDEHILSVLTGAQFDVQHARQWTGAPLSDYQLVVLNNWDLESMPQDNKAEVESYVRQGGGLLVIGGERNVFLEDKTKDDDILYKAMPAKLAPPRSPEGTAVILIVDKSSSMEGRKMELARLAAIGAVNQLRPIDQVGVLSLDNTFEWAFQMRKADDKPLLTRIISGIRPDGGTQIAPALQEAFTAMRKASAASRHIVLLTDGISEEGNSFTTANAAKNDKITISTVGIGQDVNKAYLERVATTALGKSYFVIDLNQLEQILIKDVLEHTGTTTVEEPMAPQVTRNVEILNDVGIDKAPQLKGYVRYIAKPTAETILKIDREDPLLARWQYGLGRATVFASDAKSRWATDWISWKGYDKFWTNIARDLLPHTEDGESRLTYDSANGELVASYRLGRNAHEPATLPKLYAFGPGGFQQPVELRKIAAGAYEGRIRIGTREGLFRVLPAQESKLFPEIGLYRPEAELTEYGNNEALLKQVADYTGGQFNPEPADVFTTTGKSISTTLTLWPGFLGLAVLLSLAELVLRKWKGLFRSSFIS